MTTDLSPREREVAALVYADRTDRQIARELGIAIPTVREMLRRIAIKLRTEQGSVRRRRAIIDWMHTLA